MGAARRNGGLSAGRVVLIVGGLAVIVAAGFWVAPHFSRERLEAWVGAAGAWGPLVLLCVQVVQIVVAPIPGILVPFLAGLFYGPWVGPLVASGGTLLGSVGAFALGRFAGRPLAARWVGEAPLDRAQQLIGGKRWLALVPLFLVPFSPSDALCIVAGLIGLDWRHFLLAVALGRLPKDAALALAGAGLLRLDPLGG
jgi:uncharacterized membrane protein YdjX (TVP38/TMEM64 family)